ncbi:MAG: DUF1343 domain-containing protein, partial [Elusimicrobia bacterium]|nr:DUF1343 domain-containing protein [Elusimicrobiota bacterium]
MTRSLFLSMTVALCACAGAPRRAGAPAPRGTMSGLDVLVAEGFQRLRGKRVGVITNRTGVDRRGRSIVELFAEAPEVTLAAVFTPEHGFAANTEADRIASDRVRIGGRDIPIHSLYAGGIAGMRPKPEQLQGLDVLIFDIQDIGARFYTYLASMAMGLEEAKAHGVEFMVLDRPNPIRGDILEGPILDDPSLRFITPTAYFQVPVRHGLTAGEMALWHNRRVGHSRLTVVKLENWKRSMWHDQTGLPWVPPSPNIPDLDTAALYSGVGIFESSNLSVGRGTPSPLSWIGAPWLKAEEIVSRLQGALDGVQLSVQSYTPAKNPFQGQECRGVKIAVTDRDMMRPMAVFRHLALALRETNPAEFQWQWDGAKRMVGTGDFRLLWETAAGDEAFLNYFDKGPREFESA